MTRTLSIPYKFMSRTLLVPYKFMSRTLIAPFMFMTITVLVLYIFNTGMYQNTPNSLHVYDQNTLRYLVDSANLKSIATRH